MTFYERYKNGEDGRLVYDDIYTLGQDAFNNKYYNDIQKVLIETFRRVAYNLNVIYSELQNINYAFKTDFEYSFEHPLLQPLPNTEELLIELEETIKDFGHIPYSLKFFYKIVGSCNFGWDYNAKPNLLWQLADPIQICSLDDLLIEVGDEYWDETLREVIINNHAQYPYLDLAADCLHKDNISGGPAYAIQITKEITIDSLFLNEPHKTTFINYLRICMENCGFPGIINLKFKNDYKAFFEKVNPLLKKI